MKIELISRIPAEVRHETPILFIHGAWHGAWCWEPNFMPYFADKGYAVYALSLRGHGKSHGRAGLKWYRVKDYVEDLRKIVAKLPGNPVLVDTRWEGTSFRSTWSAMIAQALSSWDRCPTAGSSRCWSA